MSRGRAGREIIQPGSVKLVMAGTGCENAEKVEQVINCMLGVARLKFQFRILAIATSFRK